MPEAALGRQLSYPLIAVVLGLTMAAGLALPAAARSTSATPAPTVAPFDPGQFSLNLHKIAGGFKQPVDIVDPGDGSGRLFVVEQAGTIRFLQGRTVSTQPFLDLTDRVGSSGNEQGLLGLAFHPDYARNGLFYIDYTDLTGDTVVASYQVSANDANRADPASARTLLSVDQPFANHNGGQLQFGPDGLLYISFGDGGSAGDPRGNGQRLDTLLGKILRIDVDHAAQGLAYAIPTDNPFISTPGARPEIWAYGLRNPWRFSFDRATDDLWIGDVGQGAYEEIDLMARGQSGTNFGWNIMEGAHCYGDGEDCDASAFTPPVAEYSHDDGCSVTGGFVYRGVAIPRLHGVYLFADFCSGNLWGLGRDASGQWVMSQPIATDLGISSFGQDAAGELYLADRGNGDIYRIGD